MTKHPSGFDKQPLPLMAASFAPGASRSCIAALGDEELRLVARMELHYYRGEGEQCVALATSLLDSPCYPVQISAALMFTFGSLCAGDPRSALRQVDNLRRAYEEKIVAGVPRSEIEKVYAAFVHNLATVLLHLVDNPFVEMDLKSLPGGVRMLALYVLAHSHYLKGEYGQAVGVAETALSLSEQTYPVGEIYLHLIASIAYMNMQEHGKADTHFLAAWALAKPEGFIEPFAEHHGLLHGLVEVHLRKAEPEGYENIIRQVYIFAKAWRQVHNPETGQLVADNLTTMEFTVAMLASRGWRNERIGGHMGISVNTVRTHMASIYLKLGIKSRKELMPFMLK